LGLVLSMNVCASSTYVTLKLLLAWRYLFTLRSAVLLPLLLLLLVHDWRWYLVFCFCMAMEVSALSRNSQVQAGTTTPA
jgi:hypothetical protein